MTTKDILTIEDLYLERSPEFALSIDKLQYGSGTIVCLAGANGSGKTTLVECLAGILIPSKGEVKIKHHLVTPDKMTVKRRLGFVPDDDAWIIAELTAKEYFELLIKIYRKAGVRHDMDARLKELSSELLFTDYDSFLGDLSHGNKKKVQIIAALLHRPAVVIVDEVRNGLDPIVIKQVEKLLQREARQGTVIIAATHDLWWAERFARRVIFLHLGQVVAAETTRKLVKTYGSLESCYNHFFYQVKQSSKRKTAHETSAV